MSQQQTMFGVWNATPPEPQPELVPPAEQARRLTSRDKVLAYLEQHGTATNLELNGICFRYGARLQELRAEGYLITKAHAGGGVWRYTLVGQKR